MARAAAEGRHVRAVPPGRGRRGDRRRGACRARLRRDGSQRAERRARVHRAAALAARRRGPARAPGDGRAALGAARRVPRRPRPRRARSSERVREAVRALRRATRPCSATRSATRSRPRSCAGTAAARSSGSCSGSIARPRRRTPRRWSRTSTTPRPSTCELPFLDFVCFNVYPRVAASGSRRTSRACRTSPATAAGDGRDRPRQPPQRRGGAGASARLAGAHRLRGGLRRRVRLRVDGRVASRRPRHRRLGLRARPTATARRSRRSPRSATRLRRDARSARDRDWPRVSVVVCTYNGARTLPSCLDGLRELEYPDYEVIVVDDGSTDATATIAREYGFRLISTENRGLSARAQHRARAPPRARSSPTSTTTRCPDPHWLTYLAHTFMTHATTRQSAGPNIPPPDDGPIAECVAQRARRADARPALRPRSPSTSPAATWRSASRRCEAIGGFDPQFRIAGDDVDICWRLQRAGLDDRLQPGAMVWHHRRNSVRAYLKQQRGYGKAEAMLERKWPEKYNRPGTSRWARPDVRQRLTRSIVAAGAGGSTTAPGAAASSSRSTSRQPRPARVAAADARVVPRDRRARRASPPRGRCGRRCCWRCRCSRSRWPRCSSMARLGRGARRVPG